MIEDGEARKREVEVGTRNDLQAAVQSGLRAGERVIVHPAGAVADGVEVEERRQAR